MEYYDGIYCVSARELIEGKIMTSSNYKQLSNRGRINVVRRGGGAKGDYALVAVDSLPERFKNRLMEIDLDTPENRLEEYIKSHYEIDQRARDFYFSKEECGLELKPERAREYVTNASVLNTCIRLYENGTMWQKIFGGNYSWEKMTATVETLRKHFGHTLPTHPLRFRKKVNLYKANGYFSLISEKYGNQSARKVDYSTERLILAIAIKENKPWAKEVLEIYNSFVTGEVNIWDPETGVLYDPEEFTDRNGNPKVLSEATITNYLNKPKNKALIEHRQMSATTFMHEVMPHMHRHRPEFSLSKVSFDDRDLPRKLKDSKQRPKAYYAYDVASDCCIGFAYNRSKNQDLVVDMFRNMFRLLDRHGWGCPAEVEVENHLMSQWKESFLRAGVMFPFVRFCAPMNSQEKHAEHKNRSKKISIEHRNHVGIGRFYAKSRQYRTESTKVFDELNNTYEEKQYYSWDELIADDLRDIHEYNHALHPNQKKYKGMTRWDVLKANINPTLRPLDKAAIARYVGEKVSTSIRRNSYCRILYKDWWLSKTEVIERLAPNDYKVDAYYLTDDNGKVTDMFIYQGDMLIDRLEDVGTYNTAHAERTGEDERIFVEQQRKVNQFKRYIEDRAIGHVGVMKSEDHDKSGGIEEVEIPVEELAPEPEYIGSEGYDFGDEYGAMGLEAV